MTPTRKSEAQPQSKHSPIYIINEFGELEEIGDMRRRYIRELAERQRIYGKRNGRKK